VGLWLALFGLWFLAGCAESRIVAHAAKAVVPGPGAGQYKVGKPYEVNDVWYYPATDYEYDDTGIASWYGQDFDGKPTANGEVFRMNELSAAHKTLPLPSMVRVTNLENGRALALRVNDRGPFALGRIIDVSRRAAQLLGFEGQGTARVRVEIMAEESRAMAATSTQVAAAGTVQAAPRTAVVAVPLDGSAPAATAAAPPARTVAAVDFKPDGKISLVPVRQTRLYIQAGAFAEHRNAMRLQWRLAAYGNTRVLPVHVEGQQFYRVRLGPIATVAVADRLLAQVLRAGMSQARLVVD